MTTDTDTEYEALRLRHLARAGELLPPMLDRLTWPAADLARHRTTELRRLLGVAREASPWHRARLAGIDLDRIDESDLTTLPVMTKDDLMAHFDDIVTDDRLDLRTVEDHLASLDGDAYLFGRYHAAATGGSTGRRGVVVFDWDAWATCYWTVQRHTIRALRPDADTQRVAMVASSAPTHMTRTLPQTFSTGRVEIRRFPVATPLAEIVAGLNEYRPTTIVGYPSALHMLAAEARAGRLRIAPTRLDGTAEPMLPEIRAAVEEAFGVPVGNNWALTEGGGSGQACAALGMHLADDLLIVELVDEQGRPVPPGTRSAKVYLTNLFNHALPLIRYEVTDQIELLADETGCPCGSTHRRIADPFGRLDDVFDYAGTRVHPNVFRGPLARRREIVEYQVRQTPDGAAVTVRTITEAQGLDPATLAADIAAELTRVGVTAPRITVTEVASLPRKTSGKLVRFVPLAR
ncbi:phenylacetate--CoA ligase family protein [Pseudonocardia pini]|uniref:phenylacetate--CoA ligase family protein n=1 Tax=Pseudonocardia pini TaxID=2758030 RepID=UPI0015F08CA9|nr:phenylacetate--CoA ligase family protein [Pseudonocardia pini]